METVAYGAQIHGVFFEKQNGCRAGEIRRGRVSVQTYQILNSNHFFFAINNRVSMIQRKSSKNI
jgi:hypothetical protein